MITDRYDDWREQQGKFNLDLFNQKLANKLNIAQMQFGVGPYEGKTADDRRTEAQERMAAMHYGPGGSLDRLTAMQERIGNLQFGGLPKLREIEAATLEKILPYAINEKLYGTHRAYYDTMDLRNRYMKTWFPQSSGSVVSSVAKPSTMNTAVNASSGNVTKNLNNTREFSLNTMGNPLYDVNDDIGVAKPSHSIFDTLDRINRINTSDMF